MSEEQSKEPSAATPSAGGPRVVPALLVLIALASMAAAFETRLSVFTFLLSIIALAATTRLEHPKKRLLVGLLAVGTACTVVGICRFVLSEALPGIIEARGRESSKRVVSKLREFYTAENAARRYALMDHDGDGIGSAGLLGELAGSMPGRGKLKLEHLPLAPRNAPSVFTSTGPALVHNGFLVLICVPTRDGGYSARAGADFDEEKAERNWRAYAWPQADDGLARSAYFIDEHERILVTENEAADAPGALRLVGSEKPPACDDLDSVEAVWTPWRDKQPLKDLPGDTQPGAP